MGGARGRAYAIGDGILHPVVSSRTNQIHWLKSSSSEALGFLLSANSTEYLMSTVDGTVPLKGLILADARFLSVRFHVLAIIMSFALASGPSEVLLVRESHHLHDSNSLKGVGFGLSAKGMVFLYTKVEEDLLSYDAYEYEYT
ncbi:hypothetical protein Tco_1335849 [Tanacetum coccineum]